MNLENVSRHSNILKKTLTAPAVMLCKCTVFVLGCIFTLFFLSTFLFLTSICHPSLSLLLNLHSFIPLSLSLFQVLMSDRGDVMVELAGKTDQSTLSAVN